MFFSPRVGDNIVLVFYLHSLTHYKNSLLHFDIRFGLRALWVAQAWFRHTLTGELGGVLAGTMTGAVAGRLVGAKAGILDGWLVGALTGSIIMAVQAWLAVILCRCRCKSPGQGGSRSGSPWSHLGYDRWLGGQAEAGVQDGGSKSGSPWSHTWVRTVV